MAFDPETHHRQSTRLKGYDYSQAGLYFITICTQHHTCIFGDIHDGDITLNAAGKMVKKWWVKVADKYDDVGLGQFIVMPNHFHGIIQIVSNFECKNVGAIPCNRPGNSNANYTVMSNEGENVVSPLQGLGRYISWFKRMSTNEYIRNVRQNNWQPFDKKLWQRNYYEHVIRNEDSHNQITEYIQNNPLKWEEDKYFNGS